MILTPLEKHVMEKILEGDCPVLATLREQLNVAIIAEREMTGTGFFSKFALSSDAPNLSSGQSFEINDLIGEIQNVTHGVGFVLFVRNGKLDTLEGFTYEEAWPDEVSQIRLSYRNGKRNIIDLCKSWERGDHR